MNYTTIIDVLGSRPQRNSPGKKALLLISMSITGVSESRKVEKAHIPRIIFIGISHLGEPGAFEEKPISLLRNISL